MGQKIETIDTSHQEVREYDPKWAEMFERESERIRKLLGDKITRIEHIGSTSIPGLASKPIIDIAIEIPFSEDTESLIDPLSTLGYPSSRDGYNKDVSTERHLLRKCMPTEYHLSVCYGDKGSFLERQILFRDYLREHDEDRDAYGVLKKIPTSGIFQTWLRLVKDVRTYCMDTNDYFRFPNLYDVR